MDVLQRNHLKRLASIEQGPCVSVYLPTEGTGARSEQDAIRLRNGLRVVERQLTGHWMRGSDSRSMLAKASSLPDDSTWWQQRDRGMAIFIGEQFFEGYRLPIAFPEVATVAHRFRIRPLIPLLHGRQPFYVLQLSQNQAVLYSADEQSMEELDAKLPKGLREALNYDGADRGAQVHSALKAAGGKEAAVFHGQGGQPDATKDDLLNYCRLVDKAVSAAIKSADRPLLLTCVDYLAPIYRKANTYNHLLEQTLSGNQEYQQTKELHQQALQVVNSELANSSVAKAVDRYRDLAGTKKTCDDIREIVLAATEGRIEVLLCDPRAAVLGVHRPELNQVEVTGKEDDEDLIDLAAADTIRSRGDVYSIVNQELPSNSPMAAIFRY